ncbi:MAG: ribbon-helix-helix domain-containing protein [Nisaea sp.]|jgi:predicted DNA-binding ribbon-helix-helix protein|uniref:ribbon-helix-helix domain-containing protein n=1 Tax=Nisaea sp. TaxID=2024842 RepID=UPI001B0FB00C|nr:ribbon-helix-helix domain-containing protein [Nisaea sp.]MBO6560466.1 ribbon-helix-helix domain-containing protein [Nisaea sp.]
MSGGDPTHLRKRTVTVSGHQTSISLEEAFWEALKEIARKRELSINALVSEVDATRSGNLSSALRVYVLADLQRGNSGSVPE